MQTVRKLLDRVYKEAPRIASAGRSLPIGDGDSVRDPLAAAIADISGHYGKPRSVAALTAGLPLVGGRLPLEHVELAAERAGLEISNNDFDPQLLQDQDLPAVAITSEGQVEIIWRLMRTQNDEASHVVVGLPGHQAQSISLPLVEFASTQPEKILRLVPASGLDERGEAAAASAPKGWLLPAFRESRHIYAQAIAATVAINMLALTVPLFSMNVYDRVLPNSAETTMWALALGVMIAIGFDFLIRTLRAIFVDAASRRADVRLSSMIYGRLLGARLTGKSASTGVRANTVREFETLREFLNSATVTAFGDLPFLFLFLVVIWVVAGPLMFVVAAAIPLILGVGWLTQRSLHKHILASFQEAAQKNAVVVETLVGLESIKAAGAESWAARSWEKSVAEHVRTGLKIRNTTNLGQHVIHAIQTSVQVLVVVFGFYMSAAGDLTMGALIATTILSGRALAPLAQVAGLLGRLNQARIAYSTLDEIVSSTQERRDGVTYLSKTDIKGAIAFESVSFSYEEDAEPAVRELVLDIQPGESVAIIGGIGSGKTTALKLIQNFYQPGSGRVLLDGTSVSQIEPAVLRAHVGLHLQGADLFHGTIRENIAMADAMVTDQAVIDAARVAGALDWIARLPLGFDTPVRERGAGLSGGQRQSVALARALLKFPPVLLLDEPTSDMDGRTEQLVIQRLKAAATGRTLVVVTHRPALLELVDRLVVMEGGRIAHDGPKASVLEALKKATAKGAASTRKPQKKRAGVAKRAGGGA